MSDLRTNDNRDSWTLRIAGRACALTNFASSTMYFGMLGSIFFLSQLMPNVLHNTPLQAGPKILVWTGATIPTGRKPRPTRAVGEAA